MCFIIMILFVATPIASYADASSPDAPTVAAADLADDDDDNDIGDDDDDTGDDDDDDIDDPTPPLVFFALTPAPNSNGWHRTDVRVRFSATDDLSGVATVSPAVTVATEGPGQTIVGTATDFAGNVGATSVVLNIDKTAPSVVITGVSDGLFTTSNVSPVATITDAHLATNSVTIDGQPFLAGTAVSNEGSHILIASGEDLAQNATEKTVTFTIDRTPPLIDVTGVADGDLLGVAPVPDVAVVDADSGVAAVATLNGAAFQPGTPVVADGVYELIVTATDGAGNVASVTVNFTVDRTGPTIVIVDPVNDQLFGANAESVTVNGTVDEPLASLSVNGAPVAVGAGLTFSAVIDLEEGTTGVQVSGEDLAGNTGLAAVNLRLDTDPPIVRIESPANGAVTDEPLIPVAGMIHDISPGTINQVNATVTVNGLSAQILNRSFFVPALPLDPGENILVAVATDEAGNEARHEIAVVRQSIRGIKIDRIAGNAQQAVVGREVADPLVVRVTDALDNPLPNAAVTFRVARGDGTLVDAQDDFSRVYTVLADAAGEASARFVMGTRSGRGNHRVRVSVPGAVEAPDFCLSADPDVPDRINVVSGDRQLGIAGRPLLRPLEVIVTDFAGNPIPAAPVTFAMAEGYGHFDGSGSTNLVTDDGGRTRTVYTAGLIFGHENNVVEATLDGTNLPPAVFFASSIIPGAAADTTFTGVVLDNTETPIVGASVFIRDSAATTTTDPEGRFSLDNVPVGGQHLIVDGGPATFPTDPLPVLEFAVDIMPGVENSLQGPIHLPRIDAASARAAGATTNGAPDVTLEMRGVEGFELTVAPCSVIRPDGTRGSALLSSTAVNANEVPMPPPDGSATMLVGTIQPPGIHFDPPAPVTYPNYEGLPPGAVTEIMSFHHDVGRFVSVGTATISEDGSVAVSDPGIGLRQSGWHCNVVTGTKASEIVNPPDGGVNPPPAGTLLHGPELVDKDCPSAGEPSTIPPQTCAGGPCRILSHNGEELYSVTDLRIPGRGIDWVQGRVYRSQRNVETPMGYGWSHPFCDSLQLLASDTNRPIVRAFGGVAPGDTTRSDDWLPNPADPTGYLPPKGVFSRLTHIVNDPLDQSDDVYVLIDRNGSRREYALTSASVAMLAAIEDTRGNRMELFYEDATRPQLLTRINDTLGRDVLYQYYPYNDDLPGRRNKLARIVDFAGRELRYDYDEFGNLVEAVSPAIVDTSTGNDFPDGKKESYVYSTECPADSHRHNLTAVIRPNENDPDHGLPADGTPALQWEYDDDDRVIRHVIGATNGPGAVGGEVTYAYEDNPAAPPDFDAARENPAVLKITETDRNGNVRVYWLDDFGAQTRYEHFTRGLRTNEPVKYVRRYKLNDDSLNTIVENPEGDFNELTFDSANPDPRQRGNVLVSIHHPGPRGGDQAQIERRFVYDPFYNFPCVTIDGRAYDPAFVPPNGGAVDPARYARIYMYDYQEGPDTPAHRQLLADKFGLTLGQVDDIIAYNEAQVEDALGLSPGSFSLLGHGDLNGDGRTDQIDGNHVRFVRPSVNLLPGSNQALREGDTAQEIVTVSAHDDHGRLLYQVDAVGNVTDYQYFPAADPNGDGDASEVANPRGGNGYLAGSTQDGRELPSVTPRVATADGVPFASLVAAFERDVVGNLTARTDPRGNTWTYEVNELNQVVRTTEPVPYSYRTDVIYDANGNAVEKRIENKVPALVDGKPQFDAAGNVVVVAGNPAQFVHRAQFDIRDNLIVQDVDAAGSTPNRLVTSYGYDGNENPNSTTKPEGNEARTIYDERDLVFSVTDGFGSPGASTTTYDYDRNGNVVVTRDAEDNNGDGDPETMQYVYDGYNRLKRTVDAVGTAFESTYDAANSLVGRAAFGTVGGPSPVDNVGAGNVLLADTRYLRDELSRVFQADRLLDIPAGTPLTRPVALSDGILSPADGFVSERTEYDAASRVTFQVEDDGDVASTTIYDGINRPVQVTDAEGNVVETVYDENANPVAMRELDKSQDPSRADELIVTVNAYDVLNRLTRTVDNVANTNVVVYDSRNNRTDTEDAEGNTAHVVYDGANRTLAEVQDLRVDGTGATAIDPAQSDDGRITTSYEWDGNSRLGALIDDNGNRTEYVYDDLDRKTVCTYGVVVLPALADVHDAPTSESWIYDRDHNVAIFTDQNGSTHTHRYDGVNRRAAVDIAHAIGNPHDLVGTTAQTFEYDGLNRQTVCTDNNEPADVDDDVACTYAYDTLSRKIEETQQIGSLPVRAVTYNFEEDLPGAGRLQATAMVYPDGRVCDYAYDDNNRLREIADRGFAPIVTYDYIGANSRVLNKAFQNGLVRTNVYDGIRRPIGLVTRDGAGDTVVGFTHAYDRMHNKRHEEKLHDPGNSEVYDYDSTYRLTSFDRGAMDASKIFISVPSALSAVLNQKSWLLDGLGNWDENVFTLSGLPAVTQTRTDTAFNEIATIQDGADPATTLAHDDNGNQTASGEFVYQWDAQNRLRTAIRKSDGLLVAVYTYDCMNRRMRKEVTNSGALDGMTDFYYSAPVSQGGYAATSWRVCEEYDFDGGVESLKCQYVWGATYLDELIVRDGRSGVTVGAFNDGTGTDRQFQSVNSLSSIFAVTDEAGGVLERYQYDPYGRMTILSPALSTLSTSSISQEYLFTAQRQDAEVGLFYFKNRYYDAIRGRFVSRDPLGFDHGANLYAMVGNKVVNMLDSLGLQASDCGSYEFDPSWGAYDAVGDESFLEIEWDSIPPIIIKDDEWSPSWAGKLLAAIEAKLQEHSVAFVDVAIVGAIESARENLRRLKLDEIGRYDWAYGHCKVVCEQVAAYPQYATHAMILAGLNEGFDCAAGKMGMPSSADKWDAEANRRGKGCAEAGKNCSSCCSAAAKDIVKLEEKEILHGVGQ